MPGVDARTCAALRRAAAGSRSIDALADTFALEPAVVERHLWDRCGHDVDEPPVPIE